MDALPEEAPVDEGDEESTSSSSGIPVWVWIIVAVVVVILIAGVVFAVTGKGDSEMHESHHDEEHHHHHMETEMTNNV